MTKEIEVYKKQTNAALQLAESLDIKKFEDVMNAADFLVKVKGIGDSIETTKTEITKPLNEALKKTRGLFRQVEEFYAKAETVTKEKILAWHQKNWKKDKDTDNKIVGAEGWVVVVERDVVEITDATKIPPEFCSPDAKKIEHALKAGLKVEGAELVKSYGISAGKN